MNVAQQITLGALLACATASVLYPSAVEANTDSVQTTPVETAKKKWIRPLGSGKCDPKKTGTCRAFFAETLANHDPVYGDVTPMELVFTELGI